MGGFRLSIVVFSALLLTACSQFNNGPRFDPAWRAHAAAMYLNDYRSPQDAPRRRSPAPKAAHAQGKASPTLAETRKSVAETTKPSPAVDSPEWKEEQAEEARREERLNRIVNGICRC
jgi:hypothetical protein